MPSIVVQALQVILQHVFDRFGGHADSESRGRIQRAHQKLVVEAKTDLRLLLALLKQSDDYIKLALLRIVPLLRSHIVDCLVDDLQRKRLRLILDLWILFDSQQSRLTVNI